MNRMLPTSTIARGRAFTLIEVLVALVILAIALTAGVRATMSVTDGALVLRRHLLGDWVAQNRINLYYASPVFPPAGSSQGTTVEGGQTFVWHETVTDTPNAAFRRVEERVTAPGGDHADAILIGYIANVPH